MGAGFGVLHSIFYNKVFNELSIFNRVFYTNALIIFLGSAFFFQSVQFHVLLQAVGVLYTNFIDQIWIKDYYKKTYCYNYGGVQYGNLTKEEREKRRYF